MIIHNIESIVTSEEINFASQLEDLIKDAINNHTFMEYYITLNYEDESVVSEPVIVEEDFEDDYEETIKDSKKVKIDIDLHYKKLLNFDVQVKKI